MLLPEEKRALKILSNLLKSNPVSLKHRRLIFSSAVSLEKISSEYLGIPPITDNILKIS